MIVSTALAACDEITAVDRSAQQQPTIGSVQLREEAGGGQRQVFDFATAPLDRLIGMAELIVIGAVEEVTEDWFEFRIEEDLSQQGVSGVILIVKTVPPEFIAPRITPYSTGQRSILFLEKMGKTAGTQRWNIIGSPGTGEMPVDDKYAYFDSYDLKGFEFSEQEVHGTRRKVQRFDLRVFKGAVKGHRRCFSWSLKEQIKNNKVRTRWVPTKTCDDATIRDYRNKSQIHGYLAQKTLQQIPADKIH